MSLTIKYGTDSTVYDPRIVILFCFVFLKYFLQNSCVCLINCNCPSFVMESCTLPHQLAYIRKSIINSLPILFFFFWLWLENPAPYVTLNLSVFEKKTEVSTCNGTWIIDTPYQCWRHFLFLAIPIGPKCRRSLRLKVYRNWITGHYFCIREYWEIEQAIHISFWRFSLWVMVVLGWLWPWHDA